jgi:pimeloyl-ACP methyl ester carboxylesterase
MHHTIRLVLLLSLFLVAVHINEAQSNTGELIPTDCPFPLLAGQIEGETIDCGVLLVSEDRTNPDSPQIEIAFTILYSTGENSLNDPVIYLMGGPGGSSLNEANEWMETSFLAERDVILFDQRGTGYSYPRLYCPELEDLDLADNDDFDAATEAALIECRDYYVDEGFDLSQYNTINNAHDLADLMHLLAEDYGYDAYNLFGVSYGTRLALEAMRSHPEYIRSVIIDAVYPPNVNAYDEVAVNTYRVLNQIFDDCAADSACNAAFPNLGVRFYQAIDRFNADPIDLGEFGELTGDDFIGEVFGLAYDSFILPYLPVLIDGVVEGDYTVLFAVWEGELPPSDDEEVYGIVDEFVDEFWYGIDDLDDDDYFSLTDELYALDDINGIYDIIETYFDEDDANYLFDLLDDMDDDEFFYAYLLLLDEDLSDSDGMFNSVECYEELPFNSLAGLEELALQAGVPEAIIAYELFYLEQMMETCRVWNVGVSPVAFREPVISDIPTLVINGAYDPITPPVWGAVAAQTLSNSYLFDLPNIGHGGTDLPGLSCGTELALSFLSNPASAPDSSCVAAQRIQFITTP